MALKEIEDHRFGDDFLASYEVEAVIGSGMSGVVLRAWQISLKRQVAIKLLNKQSIDLKVLRYRFKREAQILGALSHPNIIKIYDYGIDGDTPYLVQEFLEGSSLQDCLDVDALFTPEEVLQLALQVTAGLAEAHRSAVLHRDIKPANIFRCEDGRYVLLDFGLSISDEYCTALTKTGFVVGTPIYMAPEQMRSEELTPAADINSLGIMFYQLFANQFPFDFRSPGFFNKRMHEEVSSLATSAPHLSKGIVQIVDKCLALAPDKRYQNGGELLLALQEVDRDKLVKMQAGSQDVSLGSKRKSSVIEGENVSDSKALNETVQTEAAKGKSTGQTRSHEADKDTASSLLKSLPLLFPCLLALLLIGAHLATRQTPPSPPKKEIRELAIANLYPIEAQLFIKAKPSCRVTISLFDYYSKKLQGKKTVLVDGEEKISFSLKANNRYRAEAIFAGRPPQRLNKYLATPKVHPRKLLVPQDLKPNQQWNIGTYEPVLMCTGERIAVATKKEGIFCTSLQRDPLWHSVEKQPFTVATTDGRLVYGLSPEGAVTALELSDGSLRWHSHKYGKPGKYIRVLGDRLFFRTTEPITFVALSTKDGSKVWQCTKYSFTETWSIIDNKILAPLTIGGLRCLDVTNGKVSPGPPVLGSAFITTPVVFKKRFYVTGLYVRAIVGGPWAGPRHFTTYVDGEPRALTQSDKSVFVLGKGPNIVVCLDIESGQIRWQHRLADVVNSLLYDNGYLYLIELGMNQVPRLKVYGEADGQLFAEFPVSKHQPSDPVACPGGIAIASSQRSIFVYSLFSLP